MQFIIDYQLKNFRKRYEILRNSYFTRTSLFTIPYLSKYPYEYICETFNISALNFKD